MPATPRAAYLLLLALLLPAVGGAATGIYLDVPYVRQSRDGCGSACLAMILAYWEARDPAFRSSAPDEAGIIQEQLYSKTAHGIYARDMARYLQRSGMRVFAFAGGWDDLEQHIRKGRPLIVCLKEPGWHGPHHYVVVTGVDAGRQQVLVNDPVRGKLTAEKWPVFNKAWKGAGNWTLLAVPRQTQ